MNTVTIPDDATLRESLTVYRDFLESCRPGSGCLYDLFLREGEEFESVKWTTWRGTGYRRAPQGECFKSALLLASFFPTRLNYVEGIATTGVLPVHHAWCVEADGRVVDPTWREHEASLPVAEWEYLGVPLDTEWVEEFTTRRGIYGVFGDGPVEDLSEARVSGILSRANRTTEVVPSSEVNLGPMAQLPAAQRLGLIKED